MSLTHGKYITILTGEVWHGAEDEYLRVMRKEHLTKAGNFSHVRNPDGWLPDWRGYDRYSSFGNPHVSVNNVARYDADTEAQAQVIRDRINDLEEQVNAAKTTLLKLYEYQAGPMPDNGAK